MKKTLAFTIVTCVLIVAVVAGVLIFALSGNGFSWNGFNGIFNESAEVHVSEDPSKMYKDFNFNYETIWEDADTIDSLSFDWVSGHMNVRIVDEGDTVKIVEYANRELKDDEKMKISQSGGTLEIKFDEKIFSFFEGINFMKALLVEIPKNVAENFVDVDLGTVSADLKIDSISCRNFKFSTTSGDAKLPAITAEDSIELSSVSGNISIEDSSAQKLKMPTTSGNMMAENTKVEQLQVSSVSGRLDFSGVCKKINGSSTSGEIRILTEEMIEEADMSSVSGDLELVLPENDGFKAKYSSVSGDFRCDFAVTYDSSEHSGEVVYKDGGADIDLSTTSAGMSIEQK